MASYSAPSSRPFIVVNFACKFSNTSMNTPEAKIDSATSPAKPKKQTQNSKIVNQTNPIRTPKQLS